MRSFRNLKVWEKAYAVTLDIYKTSRAFPKEELYGPTSQMRRASASVGANIAEGSCRKETLSLGGFSISRLGRRANLNTTSC
jgi:four helix bundle protein